MERRRGDIQRRLSADEIRHRRDTRSSSTIYLYMNNESLKLQAWIGDTKNFRRLRSITARRYRTMITTTRCGACYRLVYYKLGFVDLREHARYTYCWNLYYPATAQHNNCPSLRTTPVAARGHSPCSCLRILECVGRAIMND